MIADAPPISGPTAPMLANVSLSLGRLLYDLVRDSLGRSLLRLPLLLAGCTATCLVLTAVASLLLWNDPGLVGWTCLAVLVGCHLVAGLVWGMQRTLDQGAKAALSVLESRLPELMDLLLAPLIRAGQDRVPQVALSEVRDYWRQATEQMLAPPEQKRWWRWPHRLTGFVVRWWLRAELAIVEQVLAAFERRGETHISLDSLKNVVRDETIARWRLLAHANLWQLELATAAIVLVLLLLPAAITAFLA